MKRKEKKIMMGTCKTCLFWNNTCALPKYYYEDYDLSPLSNYNGICRLYSDETLTQEMQQKASIPKAIAVSFDEGLLGTLYTTEDFHCEAYHNDNGES